MKRSANFANQDFSFTNKQDASRTLNRSNTREDGLQRTPSIQQISPYHAQLQNKTTDKKRSNYNVPYQAPVLLEQNKLLLAENREMALLIHERNLMVQALQRKYQEKVEGEDQLFREIDAQKQRFVGEVIKHKEQTDMQIASLSAEITRLQEEKFMMEKKWNKERLAEKEHIEVERKKQLERLNMQYQENNALLKAQKMKLKAQIEKRTNELRVMEMESKQKNEELKYEAGKARQEAKHSDHLRKLEHNELKHYYQSKLQKIHLQHRKDKELFLAQHEAQVKRLEEEISRLKQAQILQQINLQQKQKDIQNSLQEKAKGTQKLESQIMQVKLLAKQQLNRDKECLKAILTAQNEALQAASMEKVNILMAENNHLSDLLAVKTQDIVRLYSQIETLRNNYCKDIQQQERTMVAMHSQLYKNEVGSQQERELLKVKLGVLRQADLKGLRGYYQNELKAVSDRLVEKEEIIEKVRLKYHDELRNKSEIKKQYEIELSTYQSNILELNSQVSSLQAQLVATERDREADEHLDDLKQTKKKGGTEKIEEVKKDGLQQLQGIIKTKDLEIQQLENKMKLLKSNQSLQISQKDKETQYQRDQRNIALNEKAKIIQNLSGQLMKSKEILRKEKQQYEKDLLFINNQRKLELEKITSELVFHKRQHQQQLSVLKNEVRALTLEVARLKTAASDGEKDRAWMKAQLELTHVAKSTKQRSMMEEFYQYQLRVKDDQIVDLQERNKELASDIIDARQNYACLERKLEGLIESQSVLRDLERKVLHLGKDNNLVKNLKDIVK